KKLSHKKRPEKFMYIDNLIKYLHMLLIMNKMKFLISWLHVKLILFCQIAEVTDNQSDILTQLLFQHTLSVCQINHALYQDLLKYEECVGFFSCFITVLSLYKLTNFLF
ncbi:hypothetical protein BDFG_07748, partial [Blastomyces dermatitidis ATCC 26199]